MNVQASWWAALMAFTLVQGGAMAEAQERPPLSAKLDCPMPNGDPDYTISYSFGEADITIARGGSNVAYRVNGHIYYDKSVIVSAIAPDGEVTAMFVLGEQNRIAYYRDGEFLDGKDCRLIEAKYPY